MSQGTIFQKNLDALRKINEEQAGTIAELVPKVKPRLYANMPLANGMANVYLLDSSGIPQPYFRSKTPDDEINQWVKSCELNHTTTTYNIILMGFGLGYQIKALLSELHPKGILAVVEPDALLFFSAFSYVDLSSILSDTRVRLYVGQSVEKSIESIGKEVEWPRFFALETKILVLPYIRRIRPDFPEEFGQNWRNALQRELMYRRARSEYSEAVVVNTLGNLSHIIQKPGVNQLFGQFNGVPAVLIAPGPSANKVLPELQEHQHRMLITCVNTAYPLMREHDIQPDIVFTMDHHERNILSFEFHSYKYPIYLIADPRVQPDILQKFHPKTFLVNWSSTTEIVGEPQPVDQIPVPRMSGNAIYDWLQEKTGEKGKVFGPGSVAVVAYHILARMGCRPIILIGQDLAFTDDQQYASGTIFDDQSLFRDTEAMHEVFGVEGGKLKTSDTLHLYRQLLEHEIKRFNRTVFNVSSGALIKGTISTHLKNVAEEIPKDPVDVQERLANLHANHKPQISFPKMQNELKAAIAELEAFARKAREGLFQVPPDYTDTLGIFEKKEMIKNLEQIVQTCSKDYSTAMDLLNELLQSIYFEYEEKRLQFSVETDPDVILDENIYVHVRVLDAFVRQSHFLISVMEDTIRNLD